jgi:hypothetical protein
MKPQTAAVLRLLESSQKGISPLDALKRCGCFRLSERIREIEAEGYGIFRSWGKHGGKFPGKFRVYRLEK